MLCVCIYRVFVRCSAEPFYHNEEGGEEPLLRVRVSSDEGLLYTPCANGYKGDINITFNSLTLPEFPCPKNVYTLTPLCPEDQSLDGLQETKICCFRLSAQVHSSNFVEISGVCMHFSVKYKVGFIPFDFLHQKLSIWSKLLNKQALINRWRGTFKRQLIPCYKRVMYHPWKCHLISAAHHRG